MEDQPEQDILRQLGQHVRQWRQVRKISRAQLSERSGLSQRFLASLESGKGNISIVKLSRVAQALDVPVTVLLEDGPVSPEYAQLVHCLRSMSDQQHRETLDLLATSPGSSINPRPIVLVGLRGAGKTTLGARLADTLGLPFRQTAERIEDRAGMKISEIFSLSGEAGYRRLERQVLEDLLQATQPMVIETGGSLVMDRAIYESLLSSCFVVWLRTSPEEHMQRVMDQGDFRPMANHKDAMSDLRRILDVRVRQYARAHAEVNTAGESVADSLATLLAVTRPASGWQSSN